MTTFDKEVFREEAKNLLLVGNPQDFAAFRRKYRGQGGLLDFTDLGGFIGKNLSGFNLSIFDLGGDNQEESRPISLLGSVFTNAVLVGTDLRGVNARQAWFIQTNMKEADLRIANFSGAHFNCADLTGAKFHGAILHGVNLCGAILTNAEGLTPSQLFSAEINNHTILDPALKQEVIHLRQQAKETDSRYKSAELLRKPCTDGAEVRAAPATRQTSLYDEPHRGGTGI